MAEAQLSKGEFDMDNLDYRQYPAVVAARGKLEHLERELKGLEAKNRQAHQAEERAQAKLDEVEIQKLAGEADKAALDHAREALHQASARVDDSRQALALHHKAIERVRAALPKLEREAKQVSLDRARAAYTPLVRKLAKALREAASINEELNDLWQEAWSLHGNDVADHFPAPWRRLLPGEDGRIGGYETPLHRWLREAEENGFL